MATAVGRSSPARGDARFFAISAILMTLVMVVGFSLQLAAGRSSFSAPLLVHAHAVVFFGWVMIYLAQNLLVAGGNVAVHRRLGWIAVLWIPLMLVLGLEVTMAMVQRGGVPFFFQPQHFLVFDPVSLIFFAALAVVAIRMRRRTDWHRRLMFCGMALLLGPGFGRLLPVPLFMPYAYDVAFFAQLLFPLAGIVADRRRSGTVHPAWIWGLGVCLLSYVVTQGIAFSPIGDVLYAQAVAGTPAAAVPGLAFGPPPPGL
jgi:hypothetical protein